MSYCQKCGKELAESARFCMNCGTPVMYDKQDNTNRKQVYDGVIHKCPNCGEYKLPHHECECGQK